MSSRAAGNDASSSRCSHITSADTAASNASSLPPPLAMLSVSLASYWRRCSARASRPLAHRARQHARVDLDHDRHRRLAERPHREPRLVQPMQHRHPAQRSGAHRPRAADLEHGLRRDAADGAISRSVRRNSSAPVRRGPLPPEERRVARRSAILRPPAPPCATRRPLDAPSRIAYQAGSENAKSSPTTIVGLARLAASRIRLDLIARPPFQRRAPPAAPPRARSSPYRPPRRTSRPRSRASSSRARAVPKRAAPAPVLRAARSQRRAHQAHLCRPKRRHRRRRERRQSVEDAASRSSGDASSRTRASVRCALNARRSSREPERLQRIFDAPRQRRERVRISTDADPHHPQVPAVPRTTPRPPAAA